MIKYFAYGMNTNLGQMAVRCPKAQTLGHAVLPNYEFRFARHADILENDEYYVDGVLWDITDDCLKSLDALEGYPFYYDRKEVTVIHNNKSVKAITYFMLPGNIDSMPSQGYLDMLYEGYKENAVPVAQIKEAVNFVNHYQQHKGYEYYV
jgi:gamma-glutamylcyclotransferase (GGCT)/AIG2-like uncharacterized protein YtfP